MKVIQPINQNIPIWSILCGDHALVEEVKLINEKLLTEPKFESSLENTLRYEVFKSKRDWIETAIDRHASFCLVEYTFEELMDEKVVQTCFSEISLKRFAEEYWKSGHVDQGFSIQRKYKDSITKSAEDVKKIWELGNKIASENITVQPDHVLNTKSQNQTNLTIALNRGFFNMKKDNKVYLQDGTHRVSAYVVGKLRKLNLPPSIYGFYWEEI